MNHIIKILCFFASLLWPIIFMAPFSFASTYTWQSSPCKYYMAYGSESYMSGYFKAPAYPSSGFSGWTSDNKLPPGVTAEHKQCTSTEGYAAFWDGSAYINLPVPRYRNIGILGSPAYGSCGQNLIEDFAPGAGFVYYDFTKPLPECVVSDCAEIISFQDPLPPYPVDFAWGIGENIFIKWVLIGADLK